MVDAWTIKETLDHDVEAVVDSGEVSPSPTTVVDFLDGVAEVVRAGAGDTALFE